MRCSELERLADPFLDDEFEHFERNEIELHLSDCQTCRRHVEALGALRQKVRHCASVPAPAKLRLAILEQLEQEPLGARPLKHRFGRRAFAISAAAVSLLGFSVLYLLQAQGFDNPAGIGGALAATTPPQDLDEKLIDEVLQWHRQSLPIDVNGPDAQKIESWFMDKVDFPVKLPDCRNFDASILGARLANVGSQRAALLTFEVNKSKLSVLVFRKHGVIQRVGIRPRAPVELRSMRGYSIATVDRGDVAYSFVSSLPKNELRTLVGKAALRPVRF